MRANGKDESCEQSEPRVILVVESSGWEFLSSGSSGDGVPGGVRSSGEEFRGQFT
jgi:hypothetical protein